MTDWDLKTALNHHAACSIYDDGRCTCGLSAWRKTADQVERSPLAPGEGTWSVFAEKVVVERDEALAKLNDARAKLRLITEQYKPGWVQGLEAVARSAGYDPDTARHEGVEPPDFIQDVIDGLSAENARLRDALSDIREFAKQDHVMRFDDGDISLADFCTNALNVGRWLGNKKGDNK